MNKRFNPKRVALCGLLLSMMLVLGWVEHMIPLNAAIPGIKLGLSNGVLIFAVYMLDIPTAYVLMALKVVLSCAFLGNPASMMIYGFAGGLLSLTGMVALSRVKGMHVVTVSLVGGALHNVGQVAAAMVMLNTSNLLYYMAILMIAGIACGVMAASMKTARRKSHANDYSKGVQITGRHDRFITRTVVRQKIESSSSGGTRVNSGGFSGKSGKF